MPYKLYAPEMQKQLHARTEKREKKKQTPRHAEPRQPTAARQADKDAIDILDENFSRCRRKVRQRQAPRTIHSVSCNYNQADKRQGNTPKTAYFEG